MIHIGCLSYVVPKIHRSGNERVLMWKSSSPHCGECHVGSALWNWAHVRLKFSSCQHVVDLTLKEKSYKKFITHCISQYLRGVHKKISLIELNVSIGRYLIYFICILNFLEPRTCILEASYSTHVAWCWWPWPKASLVWFCSLGPRE